MFSNGTIIRSFVYFLLLYGLLVAVTVPEPVKKAIGSTFGKGCQQLAEGAFPGMTFRVKPDHEVNGQLSYGIRLLYFSDADIEQAKAEARARGDSQVAMAPPSVAALELYTSLLVPLFFLWSLIGVTPFGIWQRLWSLLAASGLFIVYLSVRVVVVLKAAVGASGLNAYTPSPEALRFYTTLADMLSMGVNMSVAVLIWAMLLVFAPLRR